MKINFYLFFLIVSFSFAQTKEQRKFIIKNSNTETLKKLSNQFDLEFQERKDRIKAYLIKNPEAVLSFYDGSVLKEIYDVLPNGEILYRQTLNAGSARTSKSTALYTGGSLGLNIQGQGMVAYVWDGGSSSTTHNEFANDKVSNADGAPPIVHATHVMGTIVAQGLNSQLKGIAFDASGVSYKWDNDLAEMSNEAANGMLVSNHSYGPGSGPNYLFGAYESDSRKFDNISFNAPFYLAVAAAGNDRNERVDPQIVAYLYLKQGYNLIKGMANAKNIVTVGAVSQVSSYTNSESVIMSAFSSWGPTDDGRIKPDLVTKGVSVRSAIYRVDEVGVTDNQAWASQQGTSMASPGVAGVALLLQQYYSSLNTVFMRAATLKGLMLHTASEAGDYDGPDYSYGWGLVNAEQAASVIKSKVEGNAILSELQLNNNQTYTTTLAAIGANPLIVSISWTDEAGTANNSVVDPTNLNLVNDLDLRITKDGETFYPWTLDPVFPDSPAVRDRDNFRDNFEKIQIDNPNGVYTITVTHKSNLSRGNQKFSLIASSDNGITLASSDFALNDNNIFLYPNPASDILNYSFSADVNLNSVSITDVSGKKVGSKTSDFSNTQLNISELSSGIYFVNFSAEQGLFTKKFIKR